MILDLKPTQIVKKYPKDIISVEFDGGYTQKRNRHTRQKKEFEVSFVLNSINLSTLINFYETVELTTPFTWINHEDGLEYEVQFKEPLSVSKNAKNQNFTPIKITLEEV